MYYNVCIQNKPMAEVGLGLKLTDNHWYTQRNEIDFTTHIPLSVVLQLWCCKMTNLKFTFKLPSHVNNSQKVLYEEADVTMDLFLNYLKTPLFYFFNFEEDKLWIPPYPVEVLHRFWSVQTLSNVNNNWSMNMTLSSKNKGRQKPFRQFCMNTCEMSQVLLFKQIVNKIKCKDVCPSFLSPVWNKGSQNMLGKLT